MTPIQQMTITKGWRSGWRCERIRDEVGDSTLTDKEISNQLHTLIPKWFITTQLTHLQTRMNNMEQLIKDLREQAETVARRNERFGWKAEDMTEWKAADLLEAQQVENEQLLLDANRWNAFINSPMRILGWAGLDNKDPSKPCEKHGKDGYAHFGCEMWTKHDYEYYQPSDATRSLLIGFADQAIISQQIEEPDMKSSF